MSRQVSFPLATIQHLFNELADATSFKPSSSALFNPDNYPDGRVVNSDGLTHEEVKAASDDPDRCLFWPDHRKMDQSRIEPEFWIVKDQGLYLMTNAAVELAEGESHPLIYANGCNPDIDDDWYETARAVFGGDDGVVDIPVDWVKHCLDHRQRSMRIRFNAKSIRLV